MAKADRKKVPPPASQAGLLIVYSSLTHTEKNTHTHTLSHVRWSVIFRHTLFPTNERPEKGFSEREGEETECCRLIDSALQVERRTQRKRKGRRQHRERKEKR